TLLVGDRAAFIDGVTGDIEDAAQHAFADGHADRIAGRGDFQAALEALGRTHRDAPYPALAEVLLHFEDELGRDSGRIESNFEGFVNRGQFAGFAEVHIDDGTDDL